MKQFSVIIMKTLCPKQTKSTSTSVTGITGQEPLHYGYWAENTKYLTQLQMSGSDRMKQNTVKVVAIATTEYQKIV